MPPSFRSSVVRRGAPRVLSVVVALGAALPVTTFSPVVAAQSKDDLERARNLFREGLSLEAAGNWASALAKFREVGTVKLTPQVRFHTARCNEQLGHLNTALGEYKLAEYEGGQQNIPELASITQARQALEARVPKLVIRRGPGAELARVELDGVDLGEGQIGQPVAVDPGPHRIVAKLPGDKQFQYAAFVKESETTEVELAPPPGEEPGPAATPKSPTADHGVTVAPAPQRSALPWIIGGVGVAALAGSGVFYILRSGAESDLDATCRGDVCPRSLEDTQNKGKLYTTLSMVTLGVGVVGVGVAAVLLVTGSSKKEQTARSGLHFDVLAAPGATGLTAGGRF